MNDERNIKQMRASHILQVLYRAATEAGDEKRQYDENDEPTNASKRQRIDLSESKEVPVSVFINKKVIIINRSDEHADEIGTIMQVNPPHGMLIKLASTAEPLGYKPESVCILFDKDETIFEHEMQKAANQCFQSELSILQEQDINLETERQVLHTLRVVTAQFSDVENTMNVDLAGIVYLSDAEIAMSRFLDDDMFEGNLLYAGSRELPDTSGGLFFDGLCRFKNENTKGIGKHMVDWCIQKSRELKQHLYLSIFNFQPMNVTDETPQSILTQASHTKLRKYYEQLGFEVFVHYKHLHSDVKYTVMILFPNT